MPQRRPLSRLPHAAADCAAFRSWRIVWQRPGRRGYRQKERTHMRADTMPPAAQSSHCAIFRNNRRPCHRKPEKFQRSTFRNMTAPLCAPITLSSWAAECSHNGRVIVHYAFMRLQVYCKRFSIAITMRTILIKNDSHYDSQSAYAHRRIQRQCDNGP